MSGNALPPWGDLGIRVEPGETAAAAIARCEQLGPLEMRTLSWEDTKGHWHETKKVMLVGEGDKPLGIVPRNWKSVDNIKAFGTFDHFCELGGLTPEWVGSLHGGLTPWALARLPASIEVVPGDPIDGYVLYSNTRIYGKAVMFQFVPMRRLTMASLELLTAGHWAKSLNHRKDIPNDTLMKMIGSVTSGMESLAWRVNKMATNRYDAADAVEYFKRVFPVTGTMRRVKVSEPAKRAMAILLTQPGADKAPGTWWQAYNAVCYATDFINGQNESTRLTSSWFGKNKAVKRYALGLVDEYTVHTQCQFGVDIVMKTG